MRSLPGRLAQEIVDAPAAVGALGLLCEVGPVGEHAA